MRNVNFLIFKVGIVTERPLRLSVSCESVGAPSRCPEELAWAPREGCWQGWGLSAFLPLLSPGTSHCAQRHGPYGQDGPRMGWLCWSDTSATSRKSTRWAGEWLPRLVFGGHGGGNQGLISAAFPGPRSSSASPRPCLPQRTPWRSGGRAWVREGPHPSYPSGVHSGEQERNHCIWAPSPGSPPRPHSAALLVTSPSLLPLATHSACSHVALLAPLLFPLLSLHLMLIQPLPRLMPLSEL